MIFSESEQCLQYQWGISQYLSATVRGSTCPVYLYPVNTQEVTNARYLVCGYRPLAPQFLEISGSFSY